MHFARLSDLFYTLRFRLAAWLTLVVFLMLVVTTVTVRYVVRRTLLTEFDHLLDDDRNEVGVQVKQLYPPAQKKLFKVLENKVEGHKSRDLFIQLFDGAGHLLWASKNVPSLPQVNLSVDDHELKDAGGYRIIIARLTAHDGSDVIARCGCSRESVEEDIALLDRTMLLTSVVALLLAPLGGYALAGRATRPIAEIISTAAKLQPGRLNERLAIRGTGDELEQLKRTINGMLDRIASYIEQNRDFVANAAHELRSPLAAIRSTVEVALNRSRTPEEYASLLADVMEECTRLAGLVNRLLILAEGDAGRLSGRDHTVRLDNIARESVEMFEAVAEVQEITLRAGNLPPAVVPGDEHMLRQVVRNLIDNAIKYTPAGGQVRVDMAVAPDRRSLCLTVFDTGIGIAADDLPRVFERFYRVDRARTRAARGGHGLGLSICQSIVSNLGGEITVTSKPGAGSTFVVWLPLLAEGAAALAWQPAATVQEPTHAS